MACTSSGIVAEDRGDAARLPAKSLRIPPTPPPDNLRRANHRKAIPPLLRIAFAVAVVCGLMWAEAAGAQELPRNGSVVLTLSGALPKPELGRDRSGFLLAYNGYFESSGNRDLTIRLTRKNGQWESLCSGVARSYNLGLHIGNVQPAPDGKLSIGLTMGKTSVGGGAGAARYEIDLRPEAGGLGGGYTGTFSALADDAKPFATKGQVRGVVDSAWGAVATDIVPLAPGEHPRMLFRKHDVAALREKASTEQGRKIIAALREQLTRDKTGEFGWSGCYTRIAPAYCEGSWCAGHAFLYAVLGEKAEAEEARRVTQIAMDFKGGEWGGWGRAPILVGIALAYDLCYDAWDPAFRAKVAAFLASRATQIGGEVDAAWDAMWNAARGCAAIAIAGDPEDQGRVGEEAVARAEHFVYWFKELAVGDRGWMGETVCNVDILHNLLPLVQAFHASRGRNLARGTGLEWIIPFTIQSRWRFWYADWGYQFWRPMGFAGQVPVEWRPSLRFAMDNAPPGHQVKRDRQGNITEILYPEPLGARLPNHTAFALMNYPWDVGAKSGADAKLPLTMEDRKFGSYVFRSGWDDHKDVVTTFWSAQNAPRASVQAGNFTVEAFGHGELMGGGRHGSGGTFTLLTVDAWEKRPNVARVFGAIPVRGGQITHARTHADGSGTVTMVQDKWVAGHPWGALKAWGIPRGKPAPGAEPTSIGSFKNGRHCIQDEQDLGIKHVRAFGVDYSGRSGVPCVIAVADSFTGGEDKERFVQFTLPVSTQFSLTREGRMFEATSTKPPKTSVIRGTCVAPAEVKIESGSDWNAPLIVQTRGSNAYLTVLTFARDGKHPEIKSEGTGVDAKVVVGGLVLRFDGEKIVFSAP